MRKRAHKRKKAAGRGEKKKSYIWQETNEEMHRRRGSILTLGLGLTSQARPQVEGLDELAKKTAKNPGGERVGI